MYFTSTPALNSMEAIMKQPPGGNQRGGGRLRGAYPFNKADCDCRLCLYYFPGGSTGAYGLYLFRMVKQKMEVQQ